MGVGATLLLWLIAAKGVVMGMIGKPAFAASHTDARRQPNNANARSNSASSGARA